MKPEDREHRYIAGRVIVGDTETAVLLSASNARKLDPEALFARAVIRSESSDLSMRETCSKCGAKGLTLYRGAGTRKPYLAGLYIVDYDEARVFSRYEIRPHFLVCPGDRYSKPEGD